MKSYGVILSFIFHACLFALVIFWPASRPKPLEEVYQISLVMGTVGGLNLPSPVLGMLPPPTKEPNIAHELSNEVNAELPLETPTQLASLDGKPEPDPLPVPVPAPTLPEPIALPAPQKEPEPIEEADPEPETEAEPKPELPKPELPKPEPPKPEPPKIVPPKVDPPKDDPTTKPPTEQTPSTPKAQDKPPASAASALLAELESQSNSQTLGGGGGSGSGQGGGGIYDVYVGLVVLAVKPNWSMPTYSRTNLVVKVHISIDPSGKILDAEITESSGRADFDASAINAVLRTNSLPPPPSAEQQELLISFNSQELAGR